LMGVLRTPVNMNGYAGSAGNTPRPSPKMITEPTRALLSFKTVQPTATAPVSWRTDGSQNAVVVVARAAASGCG
jgi:hypothetical protein